MGSQPFYAGAPSENSFVSAMHPSTQKLCWETLVTKGKRIIVHKSSFCPKKTGGDELHAIERQTTIDKSFLAHHLSNGTGI